MTVQVLIATMHQNDHSLLPKMNINSDAIVGNQCDYDSVERFTYNNHSIVFLNFTERGVGLNRNNALMRATGDICIIADDDMRFFDDYVDKTIKAFESNPRADVIIFNIKERIQRRFINNKIRRVGKLNFLRYGAARIAFRLKPVKLNGLYFNQCFGGGTEHCAGEDTLFLAACLRAGLNVFTSTEYLAELIDSRESTWFKGFDTKYLRDKGLLFKLISKKGFRFLCLQDALRHRKLYKLASHRAYKTMIDGSKDG